MVEHDGLPLLLRKQIEGCDELSTHHVRLRATRAVDDAHLGGELASRGVTRATSLDVCEALADDDAVGPRGEAAFPSERGEPAEHGDERDLRHVVHVCVASHEIAHEVADAGQELPDDRVRGAPIPRRRTRDPRIDLRHERDFA